MSEPESTQDHGFSTLEVLVAFSILALSLAVAVQGVAQGMSLLKRADENARAARISRSVIAVEVPRLLASPLGGAVVREGAGWRLELLPLQDDGYPAVKVVVEVVPADGGGRTHRYMTFTTLVAAAEE